MKRPRYRPRCSDCEAFLTFDEIMGLVSLCFVCAEKRLVAAAKRAAAPASPPVKKTKSSIYE